MIDKEVVTAMVESVTSPAHVEEILQTDAIGESLLHIAIGLDQENKCEIVKHCIKGGADCDRRDESGLTACECALQLMGNRELATEMIAAELENLSVERAFYTMIRRGSLEVFKLFLELKNFEQEDIFMGISTALIELNVRRVVVGRQLEVFLQYQLSNYAHRYLSGNSRNPKDPGEWRMHFKVIKKNWRILQSEYGDNSYSRIDNAFLHRIRTIHNHLYFVKHIRFLKHLPIMELTFCLAIFISIFKWAPEYELFQLTINKLNIMQFLHTICRRLDSIQNELDDFGQQLKAALEVNSEGEIPTKEQLMSNWSKLNRSRKLGENMCNKIISGMKKKIDPDTAIAEAIACESIELVTTTKGRSTLRKLRRCYFRTKQLHSIQKCLHNIEAVSRHKSKKLTVLSVKRVIQVIGESIKSTKNSPNIPKKVENFLEKTMSNFSETNKYFREFFSHKYSMAKRYLFGSSETTFYESIASRMEYVEMILSIVFICSILEASRSLLGSMRRCQDLEQLRSLFQYVTNIRFAQDSLMGRFGKVKMLINKMQDSIAKSKGHKQDGQSDLNQIKSKFPEQEKFIETMQNLVASKWLISFEDIKSACLANSDIASIHRMIDWNLTFAGQNEIYDYFNKQWISIEPTIVTHNADVCGVDPSIMGSLLKQFEGMLVRSEAVDYVACTRRSLEELGICDASNEVITLVHKQLAKYYENIFFLDNKFKPLSQLCKSIKHNWSTNEEMVQQARQNDEETLQKIFDNRVNDMRELLNMCGISTVDDLIANAHLVPVANIMALEYCQLELSEMLISGYFGDNFYLLKHPIPVIHGSNFRNYLAHDYVSYNVLTDSSNIKCLVNAVVMVNSSIVLTRKAKAVCWKHTFPSQERTLKWMESQLLLAKSIQESNVEATKASFVAGADPLGVYCGQIGPMQPLNNCMTLIDLINPNTSEQYLTNVLRLCEMTYLNCSRKIRSSEYRSWYALQHARYEESFHQLTLVKPVTNSTLPQEFFSWKLIIDYLLAELTDWNEKDTLGRTILHRLIQAGNYEVIELLLEIMPETNINSTDGTGSSLMDYALQYGNSRIPKLLLSKNATVSNKNRKLALMLHEQELIPQLFANIDEALPNVKEYVEISVRSKNLKALQFIVENVFCGAHESLMAEHLPSCLSLAAYLDHPKILKYLIDLPKIEYFTNGNLPNGNTAMQHAIRIRNWSMVKQLLERGASVNWIHPNDKHPLRTSFQLAVNANSCKLVRMMKNVNRQLYLDQPELQHPTAIATKNDSWKMERCLREFGFTLLDSGQILQAAIHKRRMRFVYQVYVELDARNEEWSSMADSILGTVCSLLCRWRTIAYLEAPGINDTTAIARAVIGKDLSLLKVLLDTSTELRMFRGLFLNAVHYYAKHELIESFNCNNIPQRKSLLDVCDKLLGRLRGSSFHSKIHFSFDGCCNPIVIDACLVRCNGDDFSLPASFDRSERIIDHKSTIQRSFETVLKHLQNMSCVVCGVVQESIDSANHYFIISNECAYLFELSVFQQQHPLETIVNYSNKVGHTPLHLICYEEKGAEVKEMIELLLETGADAISANSIKQTPLHIALHGLDKERSLLLLNHCIDQDLKSPDGIRAIELSDNNGLRPIHCAAQGSSIDMIKLLIANNVDLHAKDGLGFNPAMYATAKTHISALKLLLDSDPTLVNIPDNNGRALLFLSAGHTDPNVVQLILQYDPDFYAMDFEGCSVVQQAIQERNVDWLKIVLEYARARGLTAVTSSSSYTSQGITAFHMATYFDEPEILKLILEYEMGDDFRDEIPISNLSKLRQVLTTKRNDDGFTPLHFAVWFGCSKAVDFILHCQALHNRFAEEKLDLACEEVDNYGKTPLDYAQLGKNESMINILLNAMN